MVMDDSYAECIERLTAFPGQELGDLEASERGLAKALALPANAALDAALFGILERFPDEDGYGVYWSIVHGFEHRGSYEQALLLSVRRKAVFFNTLMLGRMLNAGITTCAGASIERLLTEVGEKAANSGARKAAADFLSHHRDRSLKRLD